MTETDENPDDLSWHPALSEEQKTAIREGRSRAYLYLGALVVECLNGQVGAGD